MATRRKPEEQTVRVAPLGELRAYTISEHELEKLEQGTPVSDLFTIGVCLLSAALTVLVTVLSTPLPENRFTLFFRSLLIFSLVGAICTFLGWRGRTSTRDLAGQIGAECGLLPPSSNFLRRLPESLFRRARSSLPPGLLLAQHLPHLRQHRLPRRPTPDLV